MIAAYFKALDGWVTAAERPRVAGVDLAHTAASDSTRLTALVQDRVRRDLGAAHVSFQASPSDAATIPFYFAQTLVSTAAKETDASGRGGFGNLAPGAVSCGTIMLPARRGP